MKEIIDALHSRIKSPVFGYYILFSSILNWKSLFQLFGSNEEISVRYQYFDDNTSLITILIYPLIIAIIYTVVYPWINYFFSYLTSKPIEKKRTLQIIIENNVLTKKEELERTRSQLLDTREIGLIEKAKREEEILKIENKELREKLQSEINEIREQMFSQSSSNKTLDVDKQLGIAKEYRAMSINAEKKSDYSEAEKYEKLALEIENKLLGKE